MDMPMAQQQGEGHCHDMAGAATGHHQPAQEESAPHDHDCNNHLACGAGACGPPFGAAVILPAAGATAPALAVAQLFSDHIPSGLERPPRPASL
ncbi:hypothetical protein GJA_2936 [Janthinobacterium agaricidamnosum NBRC 102515 = DSM 9628]|uniref:Uncharacterized protein n=1 Tax=Janthinobacterium agaricidamnosum NBRC 102515 = DSM 9628 TaxID=1349767 RepID=W0V8H4_9BURK|nr:hypothetical protein GJA_2936 [Janthinobacterium agaricidamnosum NBRC 102515 = DSM 9628]